MVMFSFARWLFAATAHRFAIARDLVELLREKAFSIADRLPLERTSGVVRLGLTLASAPASASYAKCRFQKGVPFLTFLPSTKFTFFEVAGDASTSTF